MWEPTASTKSSVNIAVVSRAGPGNHLIENRPTAAAALIGEKIHRYRRGNPTVSRAFLMNGGPNRVDDGTDDHVGTQRVVGPRRRHRATVRVLA
jgi:hypothetical protein